MVRGLNSFLEEHDFSLPETPKFQRLFNNGHLAGFDYDRGGRLYCTSRGNYQILNKAERSQILIDGETVSEVDVSSSQLSILYWLNDQEFYPEQDQYDLPGIEREVAKGILVAALGAGKMPIRWPSEFKEKYIAQTGRAPGEIYKLKDVVSALKDKHPILDHLDPDNPDWPKLQFYESEAIIGAVVELKDEHDIVALPIHDSLIIKRSEREIASQVLAQQYHDRFSFEPKISVKY